MRVLALYLPQFHRVPENDRWWGEGYTEWTALKKAKSLFQGQYQPRKPLNENYYDLLDKNIMVEQARMMHDYQIDGMCFYHYYFKNGKKLLEKPAENLLKWKDIDMPYCFAWANESWIRSWSDSVGNFWTTTNKKNNERDSTNGILVEQGYGDEEAWIEHFNYLLPFFSDERYIKINNSPVFVIYNDNISCLKEMIDCWNGLARKHGIPSVYFIGRNRPNPLFETMMLQEPHHTWRQTGNINRPKESGRPLILDYDELWETLLTKENLGAQRIELGAFNDYDDSPRHDVDGIVVRGASPEKFEKYFLELLIKAAVLKSDFIFINAWNEWAEGMYLEPDSLYKFEYLEAINSARNTFDKFREVFIKYSRWNTDKKQVSTDVDMAYREYNRINGYWMDSKLWIQICTEKKSIGNYLKNLGIDEIAIYGLGIMGKLLAKDLESDGFHISYGIDRKGEFYDSGFRIYCINDNLPDTSLIVVTVEQDFMKIKKLLYSQIDTKIISLNQLLEAILANKEI